MKELDTVKLLNDFEGIKAGTIGVIVCEYDRTAYITKAKAVYSGPYLYLNRRFSK